MKKRLHLIPIFLFASLVAWCQPTITSFTPSSGSVGSSVTITGTNFSATPASNIVYFGSVKGTVTAATTTSLEVTVPSGSTTQPIRVTVSGLMASSSLPFFPTFSGSNLSTSSFATKSDFTAGSNTYYSAVGDLDNDGKTDVGVVNNGSNTVSIFRNTSTSGSISYASKLDFSTGTSPFSAAFADLDGDGKLDMVTVNNGANSLSVFRNTSSVGSISFASAQSFTTGTGPQQLAAEDIDKDGKLDIVVVNTNASTVSILRSTSSTGTISFATKSDLGTASTPYFVSVGDLTNDGKPDLAVACAGGGVVSVFRSTSTSGSVSFAAKSDFTVGTSPRCVLIQDLNSDGKQDLAVANAGSNSVSLLRNTTSSGLVGFSSIVTTLNTGMSPYTLSLADITGDGKLDIVATTTSDNEVTVLANTTTSSTFSFDTGIDFAVGDSPIGLSTADMDGDGKTDILAVNSSGNGFSILRNLVKTGQTISFAALAAVTYGDNAFNLTATATSGLPVTFFSSNTSVATISGNQVTIVGGGSTNIYASQSGNSTYAAAPDVIRSLTVNKANQTITFNTLPAKVVGDVPFTLTATASSGLDVTYGNSTSTTASISGSQVTINGVGTTTITAYQFGNNNYNAATNVQQVLTVNKGSQTITFGAIPSKSYGDADFNLTGSASSGLSLTYSSSNTSVATVTGSTVTIVGVGSTTITAAQSGNSNYNAASDVQQVLTVTKANQTITFGALTAKVLGDSPFSLSATSSSGLSVSYASSNTSVATVSGNTVTVVGVGTTTITATQGGNANYNAAASVQQSFTVYPTGQTITFTTLPNKVFGDSDFSLSATASSGLSVNYSSSNTSVATISGSTVSIVGSGTTTITASQAGNTTYAPATDVTQVLTVSKATQTITFGALANKQFNDPAFSISATSSAGLSVGFSSSNTSVATVSGNTITIVGAGTTTITASADGNANFLAASDVQQTLTVSKANQSITFGALASKVYGDQSFTISATSGSGLPVVFSSDNQNVAMVSGSTVTIVGAGTANILANQEGNNNYEAASQVSQVLTVSKAPQTLTFGALASKTFGESSFDLIASATSSLPVSFVSSDLGVATINGNTVTITGAGSVTITASQTGNANYQAATSVNQQLTVNKATQAITFGTIPSKVFGDSPFSLTASGGMSGNPVTYTSSNVNVATVSGSTVSIVGAGSATIAANQSGNSNFEAASTATQTLLVAKANQTITFAPLPEKAVSDPIFELTAFASSGLTIVYTSSNTSVVSISGNMATIMGQGTAIITASQSGDLNYNAASAITQNLKVKQGQTITFPSIPDKTYGDEPFDLSASSSSSLGVVYAIDNSSVATISGRTVTIVGAGTATITASQPGNADYVAATDVSQTITVLRATQTITFEAIPYKVFGDMEFSLDASVSTGLPLVFTSSDPTVATINGSIVSIVGAGITEISVTQTGNSNYTDVSASQTLNVAKASQQIQIEDFGTKVYGDAPFVIEVIGGVGPVTFTISSSEVGSITDNILTIVNAGSASITVNQEGNSNFEPASTTRDLVVEKRVLNAIAENKQIINGESIPELTITYDGFVNGDVIFDLDELPVASTMATDESPAGEYIISVSGGRDNNYEYAFQNGTLVIEPSPALGVEPNLIEVYPNPVTDQLIVRSDVTSNVTVYSLDGRIMLLGITNQPLDFREVPSGVYLIEMENEIFRVIKK